MAHEHNHEHHCCSHEHHHESWCKHDEHHHHEHDHHGECSCGCGHHYHHHGGMKGQIAIIITTIALLIAAHFIEKNYTITRLQLLFVYLVPYLLVGWRTLKEAVEGILSGDFFNEHFLMSVATLGALAIGFLPDAETQYSEAVFVMLFFTIGELFEGYAEGKSRESISHLMDIRPDTANVERNGELKTVSPEEVSVGETIVVRPGEKVALDGIVVEGTSSLNTTALTGESVPRDLTVNDEVISGCINLTGVIKVRTTKSFGESTVSKIIKLVESADENKSKSEAFIAKFARIYTPIVVLSAITLAFLPPLFQTGEYVSNLSTWVYRALLFLIVSCPCALVISVPLTFFGGIGGASRKGILVKGSNFMETLAKVKTVVLDKTGTLTHGQFEVTAVHPEMEDEKELLHLAAHVEHFTTHPIGAALRNAFPNEATDGCQTIDVEEIAGEGIKANVNGKIVCVGNTKMMDRIGVKWRACSHDVGTIIHVAINSEYAGHIVINDKVKSESAEAIANLKKLGVANTVMLTGDRKEVAEEVGKRIGVDQIKSELLPTDKVSNVEDLLQQCSENETLAFVGDGINDAPVLARADVGIAMGGLGSDAAIEAADIVLMDDNPNKIATAISIARRTLNIARQNVVFAIGVKIAVLLLATFGLGNMAMAVFADVGVTVIAVFNAMRALKS